MNVGYMTNSWGTCAGNPAGVTSIKDLFYISTGSDEEAMKAISQAGFSKIEMFDGNLSQYRGKKSKLFELLARYSLRLSAIYTAANFIYDEILEEEFFKLQNAIELAKMFNAKYVNVAGGALRFDGVRPDDTDKLAKGLNRFSRLSKEKGLIASFHPHLGSLVQSEEQIDTIMDSTDIDLCVDTAQIFAAGGDPVRVMKKHTDRVCYVHLKDYKETWTALGTGNVDFDAVFDVLVPHLDQVELTVEADNTEGDPAELARHNHDFLKSRLLPRLDLAQKKKIENRASS